MKNINTAASSEFHEWVRVNVSKNFVIQDIDTWMLTWASTQTNGGDPFALIELKRSYIPPAEWKPFKADINNYLCMLQLSKRAGLPLIILYFQKGIPIDDQSLFHLFYIWKIRAGHPKWIEYTDRIIPVGEFKIQPDKILESLWFLE